MTVPRTPMFWIGQAVGVAIMAIGVRGILGAPLGAPASFARFFVGALVVHDFVLAPVVFGGAWALKRAVPTWSWPTIRNALFVSITVSSFSYPFVRGFGRRPTNETILPWNYAAGLTTILVAVWIVAGASIVVARRRDQSDPDEPVDAANTSRISSP